MKWNWELEDWPEFSWNADRFRQAEELFLKEAGRLGGAWKHLARGEREQLQIDAISAEALNTSEIEGEIFDRASVQSSIRREFGLKTDKRKARPAEEGIAEMMVRLYRTTREPLSEEMLFGWHRMLMKGRRDLAIGGYRSGKEPMQIVSGAMYAPKVHYEAPPSPQVPKEIRRFVKWFNRTAPGGGGPLPALTRAGIAHIYFESIHPFEDGNGRIGRALSEKALAQAMGDPALTTLSATILIRRKSYYAALASASRSNEVTAWLAWFAGIVIESQRRTEALIDFLIDKTRLLDRLRGGINDRQEKALLRMLREGPEGFKGGMSAGKYATITGASPATVTRDLADLVEKGALTRTGELRHARYFAAIPVRAIRPVMVDGRGNVK